jgi:putative transposon-encoded protein
MNVTEFHVKGYDSVTRTIGGVGRPSAIIHVPKGWAGRRAFVILLDDPDTAVEEKS